MSLKLISGRMALVLLAASIAGCSTTSTKQSWWQCAIAGATVGGAGGAMSDKEAATWGAVGGALIGSLICALSGNEEPKVTDYDRDGVADTRDRCKNTPAGVPVDQYGCPIVVDKDADKDGVMDKRDRCLNTPPGVPVDEYGCPLPPERVLHDVTFKFNSSDLTDQAKTILDKEAAYLKKYPDTHYQLVGYTDSTGNATYNVWLSKQRADSVMNYLVRQGVKSQRLSTLGMGPKDPIADNATLEGRMKNRRVEVEMVNR